MAWYGEIWGMALEIGAPEVEAFSTRGGTAAGHEVQRDFPCWMTHDSMAIDYRGNIKMCCNVQAEVVQHAAYIFGHVPEDDPIRVWRSPRLARIRALHAAADWASTPVCRTCSLKKLPAGAVSGRATDGG